MKLYLVSGDDGRGVFGDGKWRLLEAVRETGSILKAARALGRGYRKAWEDINVIEKALGRNVVVKSRGGSEGGSTRLTGFGLRFLDAWKRYREEVRCSVDDSFEKHLGNIMEWEKNDEK